jgi:chloramphenicol 3-O phosphotransferase
MDAGGGFPSPDASPRIILLNGTGSAGKTSIARALQALFEEPYLHLGMDCFYVEVCPPKYLFRLVEPGAYVEGEEARARESVLFLPSCEGEAGGTAIRLPPFGHRLISSMHHAVAAVAGLGNQVIVDHVLWEPRWLRECLELWHGFSVLFAGVRCPLAVVEARELARADRSAKGVVRWQFERVHAHGLYDLEVDTSLASPLECAERIKRRALEGPAPEAFARLRARDH